ncbi:MAG: HPr family phosphocarrier protein [Cellvibrionaceae bacterium]
MVKQEIAIINKLGLHARAAAKLAKTAGQFSCTIEVSNGQSAVDGKSVMSLMLLAASRGTVLEVSANGCDEESAMTAIEELINNRFEEDE